VVVVEVGLPLNLASLFSIMLELGGEKRG